MRIKSTSKKSIIYKLPPSPRRWRACQASVSSRRQVAGFTLIELLVAMAILMVIVLMLANVFQQSTRAWDAGMRQTAVGLEARAAINMIQRDLSMAVANPNVPFFPGGGGTGDTLTFSILGDEGALETVSYTKSGSTLKRNDAEIVFDVEDLVFLVPDFEVNALPDLVEITLVMSVDESVSSVRVFAQDYPHDKEGIDPTDVIDTTRGE